MKNFDTSTIIVIVLTVTFFTFALFVKGFTHDLLLEVGVLLVSIKLIMLSYKNKVNYQDIKKDLLEIKETLKKS